MTFMERVALLGMVGWRRTKRAGASSGGVLHKYNPKVGLARVQYPKPVK
jgi:hypothetical protein